MQWYGERLSSEEIKDEVLEQQRTGRIACKLVMSASADVSGIFLFTFSFILHDSQGYHKNWLVVYLKFVKADLSTMHTILGVTSWSWACDVILS